MCSTNKDYILFAKHFLGREREREREGEGGGGEKLCRCMCEKWEDTENVGGREETVKHKGMEEEVKVK